MRHDARVSSRHAKGRNPRTGSLGRTSKRNPVDFYWFRFKFRRSIFVVPRGEGRSHRATAMRLRHSYACVVDDVIVARVVQDATSVRAHHRSSIRFLLSLGRHCVKDAPGQARAYYAIICINSTARIMTAPYRSRVLRSGVFIFSIVAREVYSSRCPFNNCRRCRSRRNIYTLSIVRRGSPPPNHPPSLLRNDTGEGERREGAGATRFVLFGTFGDSVIPRCALLQSIVDLLISRRWRIISASRREDNGDT